MGLLSAVFQGFVEWAAKSTSLDSAYAESKGGRSKGIALDRFRSIVDAHSDIEGIVEEFHLNEQGCGYQSLDGYDDCWTQAYEEEYQRAEVKSMIIEATTGIYIEPEDLIDWDRVEEDAYNYALELAGAWYEGGDWIPEEVLDWAFYDLSDHNN